MDIDKLLIDLEIVGQLRSSDKLGVFLLPGESRLVIHQSSIVQGLRRWYSGNCRESALTYISEMVEKCQKSANVISSGKHTTLAQKLVLSLNKAKEGLSILSTTYSDDSNIVSQILLILSKIEAVEKILDQSE